MSSTLVLLRGVHAFRDSMTANTSYAKDVSHGARRQTFALNMTLP